MTEEQIDVFARLLSLFEPLRGNFDGDANQAYAEACAILADAEQAALYRLTARQLRTRE